MYTLFLGEVNPNPRQLGTNGVSMLWQWPWTTSETLSHLY